MKTSCPSLQHSIRPALGYWAFFRLLSWGLAAYHFSMAGNTLGSKTFNEFLHALLVAPWIRWDGLLYLRIVRDGYRPENGTTQFHPLYPMTARLLHHGLGLAPEVALLVVSSAAALGLAILFHHLAARLSGPRTATFSLLTLFLWPLGWMLYAPYSEGLFLLFVALTFLWMMERRWWAASLAASAAVLTRQQGIFLLLALLFAFWRAAKEDGKPLLRKALLALSLPPLTLGGWITYRTYRLDGSHFDFSSPHAFIYSVLISPNAVKVVPTQTFLPPWEALRREIAQLIAHWPATDLASDLTLAALTLLLMAAVWRWMRGEDRLYALAIVFVAFSYYTGEPTGTLTPTMGLPRHLMLALPLFLFAGRLPVRSRGWLWVISAIGYFWFILLFEMHAWVP